MINGRIGSCLKLNGQCKGHKRVSFDVVEAYDDDHRAAGHVLAYLPFPTFDFEGRQDHRIVPQKCSTGLEVDPILQLRPNANIVLHFDDMPVETSSEGEQEVPNRYVPHPNWRDSIELARAHRDRALYSGTDGRLHIKITSWFVNHDRQNEYCESRPMTLRPQLFPLLHQRLRRTWADKIRRRDSTSHIIVTPTPGALEDEERTLHVILEKNRLPDTEWQSVLFTLRAIEGGRPQQADRRAVLVHQDVTREALGRGLGIDIDPVHIMVPSGRGQGWLQAQEVRVITRGQHIPIWWDRRRRIETTPVDATALFQLGVTRDLAWKTRLAESSDRSTSMYDEVDEEYYQEGGTAERGVPRIEADEEYTDECTLAGSMEDLHDATLHTYGLFGWHLGIRSSPIHRTEGWNLRDEVQRLWPEIHALRNIINVPALTIPQREIHVIVEFFEGRLARHGELPCLRKTFNYRWNHPAIETVYLPPGGTRTDILYHGGYDDVCQPWKEHKCSVRVDNTILVADDQAQLQNGALIDIWIYDVEEDDPTSFMQRSVTTTPEPEGEEQTWSTLHMPEESLPITLSIGGELSALEKINREWRDDGRLHGYTAIHDVSEPPEDLEAVTSKTVILEHPFDLASRIDRTDILALVDIELINPNIAMDRFTLRQVFWLRRAMSFNTVLHFLLAYELCERDMDTRCILQHNKQRWDRRDESFYVMANGDYIKLQIIGKDGTGWVDLLEVLRRVERSYQRRSIYGTSASTIATDSFAEAEELPGSQPDEEPEECGMMQIGKPQQLTPGSEHIPVQRTHVYDRWCSPQESCSAPVAIELDGLVPPSPAIRVDCSEVLNLRRKLLLEDIETLQGWQHVIKWHDTTQSLMPSCPTWEGTVALRYDIHTDGSSFRNEEGRHAGSGIVTTVHTANGLELAGIDAVELEHGTTAPEAEAAAILIASLRGLQFALRHPKQVCPFWIKFHFDCTSAGYAAAGQWQAKAHERFQSITRAVIFAIEEIHGCNAIEWEHVYGHSGDPLNEAADAASWAAACGWTQSSSLRQWLDFLGEGDQNLQEAVHWLWLLYASETRPLDGPRLDNHGKCWWFTATQRDTGFTGQHHSLPRCQSKSTDCSSQTPCKAVRVKMATANVLTLHPQNRKQCGNGISARMESLLRQAAEANFMFIGIQESRCKSQGHKFTENFHILSGPATCRGTGGVQLWARRRTVMDEGVLAIHAQDLRILKANSRQLIVRLSTKWANWILVVGHAPDNKSDEETEEWWRQLEVPARYKSWPTFGLIDANGHVGEYYSNYIGEHGASKEDNANGRALGEWAQLHQLFLPQTFAETHQGEHWTWEHGIGKRSRIDYIALPVEMNAQDVMSGQAIDLDVTLARTDHVAIQVEFTFTPIMGKTYNAAAAITPPESLPDVSWSTDVHTHAQWVASTWKTYQDQAGCVTTQRRRRKGHLSENTWHLIGFKKAARRHLIDVQKTSSKAYCRHIFATWAHITREDRSVPEPPSIKWMRQVDHSIASAQSQYQQVCRAVVQAVRADDATFYEQLAISTGKVAADEGIGGLWKHIKHLLPRQLQRARTNLRCVGPTNATLLEHFGDLEAGEVVDYEELVRRCAEDQEATWSELPLVASLSQLPRKSELEAKCLAVRTGKAPGLDGIDPSTIKHWAPQVTDSLYFLFLKAWTLGCEPIQWKGGILHPIAKTLQPSERAQDHRGIAILEGFGKRYHAMLRSRLMRCVLPIRQLGQFGGYAGQQCLFPAHILHTTAMLADQYKLPDGALFIDIKGAFHCLLRELAMESRSQFPPRLQEVLLKEGFKVEVLSGLIESSKFFGIDGADPLLARALQDAHRHTWFTMGGVCMETHRGTRPGSPLADLVFNAMVSVMVQRIEDALLAIDDLQLCGDWLGIPL